jgi:phosphohistidine phosphatase
MFELMLMRHAKSDWNSHKADIDRPLNARGRKDASRMGSYLNERGLVPHRMVVSPAQRTQETAELLLSDLSVPEKNIIIDKELYLADRDTLCEIVELYAIENQRLLVLAHNPGMDEIVSYLASTPPPLSDSGKLMTTCAVACFLVQSPDALKQRRQGELQHLFRSAEISAVG